MGVAVRRGVLARELARRGWTLADLAKAAGLSGATVSSARAGRRVSPHTLRLIAQALTTAPILDGVDDLLDDVEAGARVAPATAVNPWLSVPSASTRRRRPG